LLIVPLLYNPVQPGSSKHTQGTRRPKEKESIK
jgi:hypothetical protein